MYMGQTSVYSSTFPFDKDEDCIVCSQEHVKQTIAGSKTLNEFKDELTEKYALSNPGLASENNNKTLFLPGPLGKKSKANLEMTFNQLIENGLLEKTDVIFVTDKVIPTALNIKVNIE
jgi:ubiquitin-activating enzyme E1 C